MVNKRSSHELDARLDGLSGDGLVALLREGTGRLRAESLAPDDLGAEGLLDSVVALHTLEAAVHAEKLRRLRAVGDREAWRGRATSSHGWAARALGLTRGEARRLTETAGALARLPRVEAALAAGELGAGHAVESARAVGEIDRLVEHREAAGAPLADPAVADPSDGAVEDPQELGGAAGGNQADPGSDAGWLVDRLDEVAAERARSGDRRAVRDATTRLVHRHAPEVLVERELRARARRRLRFRVPADDPDGVGLFEGALDPVSFATVRAAVEAAAAAERRSGDKRSWDQLLADGLVGLCQAGQAAGDVPQTARFNAQALVIVEADTLHQEPEAPPAYLDGYGAISPQLAAQVCCSGEVAAIVRGPRKRTLNVGRAGEQPTTDQRRAVIARDKACIGCGAPVSMCQVHHVVYRSRGGRAEVELLVLVCFDCHNKIHHCDYQVIRRGDGSFALRLPDPSDPPEPPWARRGPRRPRRHEDGVDRAPATRENRGHAERKVRVASRAGPDRAPRRDARPAEAEKHPRPGHPGAPSGPPGPASARPGPASGPPGPASARPRPSSGPPGPPSGRPGSSRGDEAPGAPPAQRDRDGSTDARAGPAGAGAGSRQARGQIGLALGSSRPREPG